MPQILNSVFRFLASLKVAVFLLVLAGCVLATATLLESKFDREWAQWYCYTSWWFIGLLGALCLNIAAATLLRFPWKKPLIVFVLLQAIVIGAMYCSVAWLRGEASILPVLILGCLIVLSVLILAATLIVAPTQRHQIGFLIAHGGVLLLMCGAIQTYLLGIEGTLTFVEGEQTDSFVLTDRSQLSVFAQGPDVIASASFRPGPSDWPERKTLSFGQVDGMNIRVLKFYANAQRVPTWIEDESGQGPAALRLALADGNGKIVEEQWLAANQFGGSIRVASMPVTLVRADSETVVNDFLDPPTLAADSSGILSIHHDGKMDRVDVSESLGKKVAVGESGIEVEIVQYLPDGQPGSDGRFVSAGNIPRNPMLDLLVHLPGEEAPVRELAFANTPALNLNQMQGRELPVKFWFHHSGALTDPGVKLLQIPDGRLFGRIVARNSATSFDEVKQGDDMELGGGFELSLLETLRHATEEIRFDPVAWIDGKRPAAEAAALFEISQVDNREDSDEKQLVWLQRNDQSHGLQRIRTTRGDRTLAFGYEKYPLGYSLKLHDVIHGKNPGRMGSASYSSTVQLIDNSETIRPEKVDERHEISMNHPLTHGKFTFYQSGVPMMGGREASTLSVAYDPGRFLKYCGSLVICVGMFVMFFLRSRGIRKPSAQAIAVIVALAALGMPGTASAADDFLGELDWSVWQHLPVQEGGRRKPLDTLAREALPTYWDDLGAIDLPVGRTLRPTALYMAMLLDWQGWQPTSPGTGNSPGGMSYFDHHQSDRWDRAKTIRISPELRKTLRLDHGRTYFSFMELLDSSARNSETGRDIPLVTWTQMLPRNRQQLSEIEAEALELSDKLWLHELHRMGRQIEIIPLADSEQKDWMSIAALMQTKLDDRTDPQGELRDLKQKFETVRATYLKKSPQAFNKASVEFVEAVAKLGPKLGEYPTQPTIDLEVTYNGWPPYTFAWVFALGAFFFAILGIVTSTKPLENVAIACSVGSLLSLLVGFTMRGVITSWIPVINMYDSVIFMSLGTVVFGLIFELWFRRGFIIAATAALTAFALILADYCPSVLDPTLRPPAPVLRSNFWLAIHVMSIMLSYSAFLLALGIGNISLGFHLFGPGRHQRSDVLNRVMQILGKITYILLKVGVLLLAIGTILGGFWADYSWGRFWGWDPKEVWALITLVFYLAVLHARYLGWISNRALAAWSVTCFTVLVVMAWYGVNFVLGSGMHAYGSGGGGVYWVLGVVSLQCLYVLVAVLVSVSRDAVSIPAKGRANTARTP